MRPYGGILHWLHRSVLGCIAATLLMPMSPVFAANDEGDQKRDAEDVAESTCTSHVCQEASATVSDSSVGFDVGETVSSPSSHGSRRATTDPCEYRGAEQDWDPFVGLVDASYIPGGASWYRVDCNDDDLFAYRFYVPGEADDPEALLREIVQTAFGQVDAGIGRLRLAPVDPAPHITGLPSWLAIEPDDYTTRTASVTAGTITVTATLEPQRVEWTLGDGSDTSCDGPGTIYDTDRPYESQSTDCTYTYAVASTLDDPDGTYPVSAHIVYAATFTVASPLAELNGTFELGELAGPPTTQDIVVRQIQAVRTSG